MGILSARCPVFRSGRSSILCMSAVRPRPGRVSVRYRDATGGFVDTTLAQVQVTEMIAGRPVREFRSYKGRRHYSGWYWASTASCMVVYESRLELARILLADFDPAVAALAAQPFQVSGDDGGQRRRYVPDLMLVGGDGAVTVVEVKPARSLLDPRVVAVTGWASEVLSERGWAFEVWSGADAALLANIRYLAGYRRSVTIDPGAISRVVGCVGGESTIGSVEHAAGGDCPRTLLRPAILHLLWRGFLSTDLTRPLTVNTPIRVSEKGPS